MSDYKYNKVPEAEKAAMCLDRNAILDIISALRRYRNAVENLRNAHWNDGGYVVSTFLDRVEEIERELRGEA